MFNRRRDSNLETHARVVERILTGVGVNIAAARMNLQDGYGWTFQRGSATIEIYVSQTDGVGFFQVLSPILHLPLSNLLPLYRHLLETNMQLSNAKLGVHFDVVYVFSERALTGLDAEEANEIISLVSGYADDLDDQLLNEFGGRLYGQA